MRQLAGETFQLKGTTDFRGGTVEFDDGQLAMTVIEKELLKEMPASFTDLRVWDDLAALLPGTAASDDLAIIEGTWGANAPTVRSSDGKNTTITQRLRTRQILDPHYVAAGGVQVVITAGMNTTVASVSATVDVECYEDDGDGGVSADLCATAAQSINSLTKATKAFVITPTNLAGGSVLDIRITIAITDSATATAVIGEISKIAVLEDVRG